MTAYIINSPRNCCPQSSPRWTSLWKMVAFSFLFTASAAATARPLLPTLTHWGLTPRTSNSLPPRILVLRGGSSVEEEEDVYDDEEYDTEDDDEEEEDKAEVEDEEEQNDSDGVQIEMKVEKYDDPLFPSPLANLYCSLGVMFLARKVDLFNPTMVKLARAFFIAYLIIHQLVILYVRIQAKSVNDRTPIELKNPLSSVLQSQLGVSGSSAGVMKNLASSFLSSKSTVVEYDLKQARSMQSGLIFSMLFMWFLHFKMGQVQPLLISCLSGLLDLVYSPLFQVYVMGRNLERPFKSLAAVRAEQQGELVKENVDGEAESIKEAIEATAEEADDEEVEQAREDEDEAEAAADDESEDEEAEHVEDDEEEEDKEVEGNTEVGTAAVEETEPTEDRGTQEETASDENESTEIADEGATAEDL